MTKITLGTIPLDIPSLIFLGGWALYGLISFGYHTLQWILKRRDEHYE